MCYMIIVPQGRRPIPHKDASSYSFSIDQQVNLFCVDTIILCRKKSNCKQAGDFFRYSLLVTHADHALDQNEGSLIDHQFIL